MPPWAAFECERTGWTLETIPTETPFSAAASAARWPASPAPITKTSCLGMVEPRSYSEARDGRPVAPSGCRRVRGCRAAARERAAERPADLLGGDHAQQPPIGIHRHQRPKAAQGVVAQKRLERLVVPNAKRAGPVRLEDLADRR